MTAPLPAASTMVQLMDRGRPADDSRPFARTPDGRVMTYGQLGELASRMAAVVDTQGVRPGDRVAVQVEKSLEAVALHVALLRTGAVQLPLNPAYTDVETAGLLADAEPTLVVRSAGRSRLPGPWQTLTLDADGSGSLAVLAAEAEAAGPDVQLGADDPAAMLYTSGTTGRPKGAVLSHGNLAHNARTLVEAWGFTSDDNLLHVLPLFHTHGLFVAVHCVLGSGCSMTFLPRFDVDTVLDVLPTTTVMMGVPTHYTRLLDDMRFDAGVARNVRVFISGSAPMPTVTHATFVQRTGAEVLERYGMTETSMLTSNPLVGRRKAGTVGTPLPGVAVRVVDEQDTEVSTETVGAVQVRGPNVFRGYWRRPDLQRTEFTSDGWFRTGDLGRLDGDGYLELVGRSKDLIISGGMNVYPTEVEEVIDALAGVIECAVVGVPDPDLGEAVTAIVVPATGVGLDADGVRASCRARLAGFKVPKQVVFREGLPRNAMGKVEKARLRAELNSPNGVAP
jgi:malonyl-CoA/methylmalonyl-CoA synthetase